MQFKISTQEFIYLVTCVQNVVASKTTIPLLGNFLIEARSNELILTATDLTVSIRCFTDAVITKEGATTLPAKKLGQLLRELSSPMIELSTNTNDITQIIAGSSKFKINGMSHAEFPKLPELSHSFSVTLPQKELKHLLQCTSFAVSREDNRYVLTGILMQIADRKITFVGTDGKRLAKAFIAVDIDAAYESQCVIPLKAIEEITKNLLDEGHVKLSLTHDKIGVEANQTLIIAKLLSGDYPDINRVIPEKSGSAVILHKEELTALLRQISLFTSETHHSVRFTFLPGELKLSANTMEVGEGQVDMPVNFQGEKIEIAFNPAFFLDILRHCKEEVVTLWITDAYNPGLITDGDQTDNTIATSPLFVIMPMRLSDD